MAIKIVGSTQVQAVKD